MAHHHFHRLEPAHIVRRQRFHQDDSGNAATTIIQVQTEVDNDNTPPQRTLIAPAVRPRPSTLSNQDSHTDAPPTSKHAAPTSVSKKPSSSQASDARAIPSSTQPSTFVVATQGPMSSAAATTATGLTSATVSVSATASAAAAAAEGGMSGGAKAGLALGILLVFGAILAGILLIYRRKKKQQEAAAHAENEKIDLGRAPSSMPPAQPETTAAPLASGLRANRTVSTAPRLSLRPVTQFDPAFNEQRQSKGNLLSVAAAGGATNQSQNRGQSEQSPTSAWERPGAANSPVANPFNDPEARSGPPAANPFGNSAAVDQNHAGIPDSPPDNSPLHSAQVSNDFANQGPGIVATGVSNGPPSSKSERPEPLKTVNNANIPGSPAWVDSLPASPGPAPTGALPVAGGRAQSPAPGPDNVHRVQLDFKASLHDELNLQAGQLVRMLHEYDDGWALCIRLDRSQQGVVPRTCLSKHPVKPRTGPPRQGPSTPTTRGPPIRPSMGPGAVPHPRPLSPANIQHPPSGRNSPGPRQMQMQMPPQNQQNPRSRSNSNAPNPQFSAPRGRSNSNVVMAPPPQLEGRQRSNSASQAAPGAKRGLTPPGLSPMNPNAGSDSIVNRKPVPGMAM